MMIETSTKALPLSADWHAFLFGSSVFIFVFGLIIFWLLFGIDICMALLSGLLASAQGNGPEIVFLFLSWKK